MATATFYAGALATLADKDNGLTTTHQGGVAFEIDALKQLRRFLILGSDQPTFYVSAASLTDLNIKAVKSALDADAVSAIDTIVEVSDRGLAPKNDPALVALAMAASYKNDADPKKAEFVRSYALAQLPKVARTGTHLFHFAEYVNQMRGWGSGLRKAFAKWYTDRSEMSLVNQVTKYQQRDGWSHADLLRLSHPQPKSAAQNAIFKYVVDGELPQGDQTTNALDYLAAVERAKAASTGELIDLIRQYNLPREVLPTMALNDPDVWEALLYAGNGMPFTAMLRNLGTMSKIGLLTQGSDASRFVIDRLHEEEAIRKARVHPIDMLKAKMVYQAGRGQKSDATWNPVNGVVEGLESGFYLSFGNVEPTGKRGLIALDVSGSMEFGELSSRYSMWNYGGFTGLAGVLGLSPRIAAAVMAMVTVRVERDFEIVGFSDHLVDTRISKHDSLDTVKQKISRIPMGGTYINLPMQYAMDRGRKFDYFAVYTDNETGNARSAASVLRQYRKKSGIHDAKLIVNAMASNNFSVADPTDPNMLDVVGFDSSAPQVMSAFIRGEV